MAIFKERKRNIHLYAHFAYDFFLLRSNKKNCDFHDVLRINAKSHTQSPIPNCVSACSVAAQCISHTYFGPTYVYYRMRTFALHVIYFVLFFSFSVSRFLFSSALMFTLATGARVSGAGVSLKCLDLTCHTQTNTRSKCLFARDAVRRALHCRPDQILCNAP